MKGWDRKGQTETPMLLAIYIFAIFEVLTAVWLKLEVFWHVTL
jgi:hypothetical protein